MTQLHVVRLRKEKISESYPLIRAATQVSLKRWAAYVRLVRNKGGDAIALVDENGRIFGTAAFRTGSTLRHHQCLVVDAIAAFEVSPPGSIKRQLCEALREEAIRLGCTTLMVQAAAPRSTREDKAAAQWKELGLTLDTMTVIQQIDLTTVRW